MTMQRILKWLRREAPRQSTALEVNHPDVGSKVTPGQETQDEYSTESSFSWFEDDQADSSIFDTGSSIIEKSEDAKSESDNENAVGVSTLNLEKDLWPNDEDIGVDPYNTGRVDNENE